MLFQGDFATPGDGRSYDVAPDGQRFVMIKGPEQPPALDLVAAPYFLEEMQDRLRQARR